MPTGKSWTLSSIIPAVAAGALIGGAASIAWTAVVNFMINPDFKWTLLAMALLWASSLRIFWPTVEGRIHR